MHRKQLSLIGLTGLCLILALGFVRPMFGQTQSVSNIIVMDADTVREEGSVPSSGLQIKLDTVLDRIVLRFANSIREQSLIIIPDALDAKLDAVEDRVVLRFANTKRLSPLVDTPSALDDLLNALQDRIVLRFANDMRRVELVYPLGLPPIDTEPPIVTDIVATDIDSDSATILWTTNEYADSRVNYGTSPGSYPNTKFDSDVKFAHEILLSGLAEDTYYYRVESTDRSGNTAVSAEKTFTITATTPTPTATTTPTPTTTPSVTPTPTATPVPGSKVYLPAVLK